MLQLEQTTIKFGGLIAVNNVTTSVKKGAIFGLIGPNGAGKTTTFNIISGVYPPTSGKVIYNGKEIQGLPPYKVNYLGIARTYQNINLFKKMTLLENTMVGCHSKTTSGLIAAMLNTPKKKQEEKASREKCMEILTFMGLADKHAYLANRLSYGEQRKLEMARALASEPQLLLLDEPAAGMNLSEKNELANTIRRINEKGITILLVEHYMKLVMEVCNEICVLNYGKKLAQGTPLEIQNNDDVVKAYLGGEINVKNS
jgi:branched-chain amino acid transport system ATP-binding protein